ncbi:tetratricopeptide repeat protein [Saprospira sp. CCB-QB6]|uniref:tetratricopeptide repeat protein n=1 Tax=Saprospira sp. CCB-QB6 TaxID=3023936 RepID=UPI0023495508|nr:tetratricopeptide repeat protein [Saprospira sp. CCB-QB6]WCL82018.1 tetratricopeptide repeat protein [Saprospira sp. CCB-QB6]
MIRTAHLFVILLLPYCLAAQLLRDGRDSLAIRQAVAFPEVNASIILSYNRSMLEPELPPEAQAPERSLEELLLAYEDPKLENDVQLLIDIYQSYYDQGKPDKGFPYLQKAYNYSVELYEANPSNIEVLEDISYMMLTVGNLEGLPTLWEGFCQRQPKLARARAQLALYQLQTFQLDKAQRQLDTAYQLDPMDPNIYVTALLFTTYRAMMQLPAQRENYGLEELAKFELDLSFLERAERENPKALRIKLALKTAQLTALFYKVFFLELDQFSKKEPFQLRAKGAQLKALGALERDYLELLQEEPENPFLIYKSLVLLHILKGELAISQDYLAKAEAINAFDADLYKMMGFAYLPEHKYHKAIPYYERATAIAPEFEELFALARLYFENYEYEKSEKILVQLLQTAPDNYELVEGLAAIYLRQDQYAKARGQLKRFAQLYDEDLHLSKNSDYKFYQFLADFALSPKAEAMQEKQLKGWVEDQNSRFNAEAKQLLKQFF